MDQLDLFGAPIPKKEEKKHVLKKPAIITIDEPEEVQQTEPEQPLETPIAENIEQDSIVEQQAEIVEPIELSIEEITEQQPEIIESKTSPANEGNSVEETAVTEQEIKGFEDENEAAVEEDEEQETDAETLNENDLGEKKFKSFEDENENAIAEDEEQQPDTEPLDEKDDFAEQGKKDFEDENIYDSAIFEEEQAPDIKIFNEENDLTEKELNESDVETEEPFIEDENEFDNEALNEEDDLVEQEVKGFENENESKVLIVEEEQDFDIETSDEEDNLTEEEINDSEEKSTEDDNTAIEDEITEETESKKPEQPKAPAYKLSPEKIPSKRGRKSLKEINLDVALLDIPEDEELYKKNYYSITEVAEWFRVNPSLLRFWENEFDILKPRKNRKGDRLFRPEDIKNLRIIYYLLRQQKYSIEGAKQFLKDSKNKAEMQTQLVESLTKFRGFLLELRANLGV